MTLQVIGTCVWVGVDSAWEQKKLEAWKMLENAAESHTSGARFVSLRLFAIHPFSLGIRRKHHIDKVITMSVKSAYVNLLTNFDFRRLETILSYAKAVNRLVVNV